jgi:hypothetical protein
MASSQRRTARIGSAATGSIVAVVLALAPAALADSGSSTLFIRSAVVSPDHTVTLPLLRGRTVW